MDGAVYTPATDRKDVLKIIHDSTCGVDVENIRELYEKWAETYDKDYALLVENNPWHLVNYLTKYLVPESQPRILDVAAGTGRVGLELKKRGYLNLDALDASPAMLEQAKKKGCYKNFIRDLFGKNRLDINEDTYDAAVATACFTPSHVNDDCFEELLRIVRPGGYFIMLMRQLYFKTPTEFTSRLEPRMRLLEERGAWQRILKDDVVNYYEGEPGFAYVFQIQPGKRDYLASL